MAASITDKVSRVTDSTTGRPIITTLASSKAIGAASVSLGAATNWSLSSKLHFAIYNVTAAGIKDMTSQTDWMGVLSGTTLSGLVLTGGTDRSYNAGAIVEITPTARYAKDLYDWAMSFSDQTGALLQSAVLAAIGTGSIGFTRLATGASGRLGLNTKTTTGTVLPTAYTTYCTVTATSTGGEVELNYIANFHDAGSGSARLANIRVQCDGVTVTGSENTGISVAVNGGNGWGLTVSHTPAAGSHTWTLQALATAASATSLDQASLRVSEVK